MNIESHKKAIRESLDVLEQCVQAGIQNRQRTVGFHCSAASVDMLEIYLHSKNLIDPGTTIKHDFFSSQKIALERVNPDFPRKAEIIGILAGIESKRTLLCYGKPQPQETIESAIRLLNSLREILDGLGVAYE